ncbi:MAG: hypothetical protein ABSG41_11910 [Bryobacteraceae bacterium]|jgi:hypothetical protein
MTGLAIRSGLVVLLTISAATYAYAQAPGPVNPLLTANPYFSPPEVKGGPVPRLPDGKPDLQGAWLQRTSNNSMSMFSVEKTPGHPKTSIPPTAGIIVDPPDGVIPYQPWARRKQIDLSENHMIEESDAHCLLGGVPHQMYTPFGVRILQPPGYVVMTWEFMHAYRVIPLDGRPHIDPSIKLFEGDSRGKWDGDTLVIDVTNQTGRTWLDQSANFHSDAIHVVERITPIDSNNLAYEATLEDPKVYTRPWTIKYFFSRILDPNFEHLEFACIEGEVDLTKH